MSVKGKIIGVDLDGVCADFYGRMREIAAEWLEKPLGELPTQVSYGLAEWGMSSPEQYASLHRFAVTQRALFKTTPIIPGARKFLRKLSDEGARIRIVTNRLFVQYFHRAAVGQTIDWLDSQGIPYLDLCFLMEKEQVGADLYVEDGPSNITTLRKKGLFTICFGNSTNSDIEAPRAISWEEVYHIIHDHFREGNEPAGAAQGT